MTALLLVSGRVTRTDTGAGVHGLRVEAWSTCCRDPQCLGGDLTTADGTYRVHIGSKDCCDTCRGSREVCVKVRDRDGRLIHDNCSEGCTCPQDTPAVIDVALPPEALWWHLSRPLSWQPPGSSLIGDNVLAEITEAVLTMLPAECADAVACAVPPLQRFEGVLADAWATVQGDLAAAGRYRDVIEALCGSRCDCGTAQTFEATLQTVLDEEWSRPAPTGCPAPDCPAPEPTDAPGPCDCGPDHAPGCPCRPTVVARDTVIVLMMAALQLACGHAPTAVRYGAVVLDQVCRFETLGALHRAASRALWGDERSLRHLRDLVEFAREHCGEHGPCCCGVCLPAELEECIRDAARAWNAIRCYTVTEIRPPRACPGDKVVICGKGFGPDPGTVVFRQHGSIHPGPIAKSASWCDTRIEVIVPKGAGCGLTVRPPFDTVEVCDRFLDRRPHGCVEAEFEGTSVDVLAFSVEGRQDGECVEPGTSLTVSWRVCAADRIRVEVLDEGDNTVLGSLDPAPARGRWAFTGTDFDRTTRVRVQLTAEGACSPPVVTRGISLVFQAQPDLRVDGIEVTQAIQRYRAGAHLTDPADQGPDNSLRLVVDKTAWVRVYLRSGQDPAFDGGRLDDVDGTLTVDRRVGGVWASVAVLSSQNGPISALDTFATYDAERGNIDNSLNFVVPASIMTGLLRFSVNVRSAVAHCPGNTATGAVTVDVNLRQTLNAAFFTIGYDGPDAAGTGTLTLPAPTLADCQAETSWAMTTYPVSGAPNVRVAGTFTTTTPLNDMRSCPGCCSPNWQPLLQQVANLVAADQMANPGGNWVYYGLVTAGIPVNVPGCNGWGATGGLAGRPITYAHEIGHQFGLPHARCGGAGAGNANYPVYEPYDLPVDVPAMPIGNTNWTMASIGEYGLDINNGDIANPNDAEDFMSYCGPRWIGAFTHTFLINAANLAPQVVPTGSGAATARVIRDSEPGFSRRRDTVEPLVHMLGRVGAGGAVEVLSVARIETTYLVGDGVPSGYVAQLLDVDGQVLAQDVVYRYTSVGCGDEGPEPCCADCPPKDFLFKALVEDRAPGACLRIVRGDDVVWERTAPQAPPQLSRVRAAADEGSVRLSWSCTGEVADTWVRWSDDGGRTWHALTVGVSGTSAEFGADVLPAGTVRFQVLVHDGFSTVTATSDAVDLPAAAPTVSVLYPRAEDRAYAERRLHLAGTASSVTGERPADEAHVWYIDDLEVGRGANIWVDNPGPGRHVVRLDVTSPAGTGTADTTVEIPGAAGPY